MRQIKKSTLHEEIANNLRSMIMSGDLLEGDKINENALCEMMGISKTPLREALRVLSSEGLIRLIPNKGPYVSTPTYEEIREMFDVMSILEEECARTAARKMDKHAFKSLNKLHQKLEQAFKQHDKKKYIELNNRYHLFVQQIAGNRVLTQIVSGLRQKILLYRFQSLNLHGRLKSSIHEHRQLLDAFKQRDAGRAEKLMRDHLTKQSIALEKLARERIALSHNPED